MKRFSYDSRYSNRVPPKCKLPLYQSFRFLTLLRLADFDTMHTIPKLPLWSEIIYLHHSKRFILCSQIPKEMSLFSFRARGCIIIAW
jgi:hypothetical protein